MATYVNHVRNVNEAFAELMRLAGNPSLWRKVAPRGMETLEFRGTFITEYSHPHERVLFSPVRDANPFFHFMESLWIMAGRDDVAFLNQFNSNIGTYSDDGVTFNAPYGYRLRRHFGEAKTHDSGIGEYEEFKSVDQLAEVIALLQREPDTRRAVLCLWDPVRDLNRDSKDIPCNDLVTFKQRDGVLDMTVMNRSNDAMWGAYGANAVQFSMLHEFVACAVDAVIGNYRQVSDSFHVYTAQSTWQKCYELMCEKGFVKELVANPYADEMGRRTMQPYRLMSYGFTDWRHWLRENENFLNGAGNGYEPELPFFKEVALPMWHAWWTYKDTTVINKDKRIWRAQRILGDCVAEDWRVACCEWLERRREVTGIPTWGKDRI